MRGGEREIERFGADQADAAGGVLLRDGVVILDGLWPAALLDKVREFLAETQPEALSGAESNPGFASAVGHRRQVHSVLLDQGCPAAEVLLHPALDTVFALGLGADYLFEAVGVISAAPGAKAQHAHRDGGTLFPGSGLDRMLPPAALTLAIPLVDQDADNGLTAFWPGTHRDRDSDPLDPPVAAPMPRGSAAVWDYRVLHRGEDNRSTAPRPLLYVTVCRPFWTDHMNFESVGANRLIGRRAFRDAVPAAMRKRFTRLHLVD